MAAVIPLPAKAAETKGLLYWMERVLERLVHNQGVPGDLEMLDRVSGTITGLNLCALGDSIEPFLKSVMERFPEQFKARIAAVVDLA